MAGSGLTFKLFGEDVSASSALEGIQGNAKKIAGGISAAFGAIKIGEALAANMDNSVVTAKFAAGLGQTPAIAKQAGDLAGQMYRDGVGGSLEEVQTAVGAVGTSMLDLSTAAPADISRITTSAQAVATVMGTDVTEVTRAAGQMFKNGMAPSAEAALDMIAQGATSGANASGDLLETLTEYPTSFNSLGLSGSQATAMMKAGLDAGIVSTDKAADAFNELGVRAIDGSKGTGEAYAALGLDAGAMAQAIAAGGPTATAATGQIMTALSNMTDPVAQESAGVALFGSMWEDCGATAILAMNPATVAITDASGAASEMGDTLAEAGGTKVEALKRGMDGLLQDATALPGPMGDVVAGVMAFGPSAIAAGGAAMGLIGFLKEAAVVTKIQTAAQWLFNAAMSMNPIALVVIAIAALVAGFVWLWMNVEGFRNFFIAAWEMIKAAFMIVVDAIVWYFTTYFNIIMAIFQAFLGVVSFVWEAIKAGVSIVAEWIGSVISGAIAIVTNIFTAIGGFIAAVWQGISDGVTVVASWIGSVISGAVDVVRGVFQAVGDFIAAIWQGISDGVTAVGSWIGSAISGAIDIVRNVFQAVGGFISTIWEGVKSAVSGAASWIGDTIGGAISTVQGIFEGIGTFIGGIWEGIKTAVSGVGQWIQDKFQAAVTFVTGIFGGIGSTISGAFTGIADFVKAPINAAIKAVNWAIDQLNKISFDIPDWVPGVGGNHFGISLPHIATLASGGVAMPQRGGTAAIIGEAGEPEAVIPLSKWASMTGGNGGGTTVVVNVTGAIVGSQDALARAVVDAINGATRRGTIPRGALV